jgi:hypothetical protein
MRLQLQISVIFLNLTCILHKQAIIPPSFSQFICRKINQEAYRDVAFTVPPKFPKTKPGNRYEDQTKS